MAGQYAARVALRVRAGRSFGRWLFAGIAAAAAAGGAVAGEGENASKPGQLTVDPPTLVSLGVCWLIDGDANKNAEVTLEYRKAGETAWKASYPLMRAMDSPTPSQYQKHNSYFYKVNVPAGTWRFAGSAFDLQPDTEYELRVKLKDPDGGEVEEVRKARTRAEPPRLGGGRQLYAAPGGGGGSGTKEDPFRGLAAAQNAAQPGDTIWLAPGEYAGPLAVSKEGAPGKPIVWRGMPAGDAVVTGGIRAGGKKFVAFDSLVISGGGISADGASDITVRYCRFEKVSSGITARDSRNFYVADNEITGPSTWPRTKGIEPTAGIDIGGQGHAVCHNRIRGVADGISCLRGPKNIAIDFYLNEITECTDDGIETDYVDWNVRCFRNRLTNVFQGISCQPVRGGPVFIFRNAIYNSCVETFKLHNYSSGVLIAHNSSIKKGTAIQVGTPEANVNIHLYNNLFAGTGGGPAINFGTDLIACTMDYNGVVGDSFASHARWSRKNLPPLDRLRKEGPIQQHGHEFKFKDGGVYAAAIEPPDDEKKIFPVSANDQRLREGSPAVDKGTVLPGISDGYKGAAPDLGAYELGDPLPHYGPRPDPEKAAK